MKNIFKYFIGAGLGLLMVQTAATAGNPIKLNKTISGGEDGKYTIRLESYVTGESMTDITTTSKPVDLVLVLDVSGSMNQSAEKTTTYEALSKASYSYNSYGNNSYYYLYEGQYIKVQRGTYTYQHKYYLSYSNNGTKYLDGTQSYSNLEGHYKTSDQETIWTGVLYTRRWRLGGYEYTARPNEGYSYSSFGTGEKFIKVGSNYYQVTRHDDSTTAYCLYFDANGTRFYITSDGLVTTPPTGSAAVTSETATIYTGVLYEQKTIQPTKMELLKEACNAFIEEIYKNSLGPDGIAGTSDDIDNQISIVKFAKNSYYGSESSLAEGNHDDESRNHYNLTEVVKMLKSVRDNKSDLINGINSLKPAGATAADYGLTKADYVLKSIPASRESNKVVLLFTDGEPNHDNGFDTTVASTCINKANTIKNTDGAKVYTVGVFNGLDDSAQRKVNAYMSCVSSRYENVTAMPRDYNDNPNKYEPQNGSVGGGVAYYQTSDGTDLKSIFESIAHGSTTGGGTITIDATSSTLIDVVSANFTIPSNVEAQGIKVWSETCTAYDAEKGVGTNWTNDNNVGFLKPEIIGNQLSLTGFNYTKDDEWNSDHTNIDVYGNWVGNRTINGISHASGKRLVVEFNVELNPEYTGGQDMPSNDLNSGLYYTDKHGDEHCEPYPVPVTQFPSICIMKDGLKVGESAVFQVKDGESNLINTVVLTQKESNGVLEPCYVVIKKLSAGKYTVTETNWSWAYTANTTSMTKDLDNLVIPETYAGTYSSAKEYLLAQGSDLNNNSSIVGVEISDTKDANQVYCVLKDKYSGSYSSDYSNSAISVLFHFKNTSETSGKPARAEAWVHNRFKGGTATSGGTEQGTDEEEEGIDD